MLSDAEARLVADAALLRNAEHGRELWFAAPHDLLPECHRLVFDRGYLDRRWHGDNLVYRLTDEALTAQALHGVVVAHASRN